MDRELTPQQAREIMSLRRRHARAELLVHHKPWGVIVEARRAGRTLELKRFDWSGDTTPDRRIRAA